jgi:hypothetical protein
VPDFRSPLDGMVGGPAGPRRATPGATPPSPPTADDLRMHVFISGAGASDPRTVGLDEDIRLLVEAFMRRPQSGDPKAHPAAPAAHAHGDMEIVPNIALHGLNLAPEQANQLRHLIGELVRKRSADQEAAP